MPKSVAITKEMITKTAVAIIREAGLEGLTARNIAYKLKCSTQPIYKAYENMDELKEAVSKNIAGIIIQEIVGYRKTGQKFLDSGMGYINFAKTEKVLFKTFCLENRDHGSIQKDISNEPIRELMDQELEARSLSKSSRDRIFLQTMISTYGLAVLAFLDQLELEENDIADLLIEFFESYVSRELGREK